MLAATKPHIVCITESWLDSSIIDDELFVLTSIVSFGLTGIDMEEE